MQDGKFQEGQISHPIWSRHLCLRWRYEFEYGRIRQGDGAGLHIGQGARFRQPNPKGFINVLGPNPVKGSGGYPYFIIRRAILLRSSLNAQRATTV